MSQLKVGDILSGNVEIYTGQTSAEQIKIQGYDWGEIPDLYIMKLVKAVASLTCDYRFQIVDYATDVIEMLAFDSSTGGVGIGFITSSAKLAINGGLHVGGDSDPGDNNALIDGTLQVTGNVINTGIVEKYNNIITEGLGHPMIVDDVELLSQSASIGSTNFTNAGVAGLYRLNYYLECTTLNAGATSILLTIAFTDDAGAMTVVSNTLALTALGRISDVILIRLASGNISYSTTLVDGSGLARYALHMSLERLR